MRTAAHVFSAAAVAGFAAAAPAPQAFEFFEIANAAPVAYTGPPLSAISQAPTEIVSTAAILASIQAEVTTVATAAITGAAASNAANISPPSAVPNKKRSIEKRDLLANIMSLLGARFQGGGSSAAATPTTSANTPATSSLTGVTSTPTVNILPAAPVVSSTTSTSSSSSAAAATSSASSSTSSTSSNGGSGTSTSSSSTACPTTPEDGTYCGFINPEDPCAPQPDGYGPNVTSPSDTPDAFMNYAPFQVMARAAVPPAGYVQTFSNLNASSSANSYMGLYTINKYDPSICAKWCDQTNGCTSFNLFIERDPSQNPCKNDSSDPTVWGYWCPNPPSITNYKCTLWGSNLDASTAVNQGGWRRDFGVVIVGSNGYDKTNVTVPVLAAPSSSPSSSAVATSSAASIVSSVSSAASSAVSSAKGSTTSTTSSSAAATTTPVVNKNPIGTGSSGGVTVTPDPDWSQPKNCSGKAINAGNYWLGSKFINGPFDPSLCAAYAKATTAQNKQAALDAGKNRYTPCQMFNAYHIYKGQQPLGTYCALYNANLSPSWATTSGQYSGRDYYSCRNSWTWSLSTPDNGRC